MEEDILKLEKLINFLEENNMNLVSCGCCDGIGIEIDGINISTRVIRDNEDMKDLLEHLKRGK